MPPPGQQQRAESKFIVFEQFEKMNTQSIRQALSEKELAWLENLQPISPNNLTTVPGPAIAITNIAETITFQFYANLGTVDYIISFTTVGSGWATNLATGGATRFAPPGTFTGAPDMTVWQSAYVLFNDTVSGYSAWNGTLFVRKGSVSPVLTLTNGGSGYTSVPTVTITGGSGSGATAVATIGTPQVNAVSVVSGGSQYGPAPTVVFSGGGGTGAAAIANIDPRGLTTLTLTSIGSYLSQFPFPNIVIAGGGGTGATAVVTSMIFEFALNTWTVQSIAITNPGSGYSLTPSCLFNGGNAVTQATASVTVGNGAVTSITLTNGGSGYTSAPTVSFSGGGNGTGASAVASIGGTFVTSITLTAPGAGYLASDVLTVNFAGGGGTGAAASAHVWPFVTNGTTLAVFAGRVWLGGGRLLQWTGTQGFDDFNAANAAGSLTIGDVDLVHAISVLRNYNNYLFIVGDHSIKQIGSISVSGSATLFSILTLSSDQGSIWPMACGSFNRVFMFGNSTGIYAVLGSAVQKISDDMDGIFKLIDFTQQPQAAVIDLNNIHNISWLVRYKDPAVGTRSILMVFNGKKWFIVSQGNSISSITTATVLSNTSNEVFSSSGTDITQICANAAQAVSIKMQSALTHHGNAVQRKKGLRGGFAATAAANVAITKTMDTEEGTNSYTRALTAGFQPLTAQEDGAGRYLGATVTGTVANFTMTNLTIEYQESNVGNK